ncbi:hypothetical protein CYLTODRAFT_413146 [Cylindrobasidium torrendii FP15055 ss-10]|uniref:Uncharacterized protein n=1 Tax=Cylindrobasidium torrendii FP15055 ss-10 TaxID=1314674 RepID=A0A0D7B2J8_9AGAR|nr:hypothetical protein CYLTODRAFT_413146 [Cylindrobasidium torrendii FP15055 ss-10]
MYSRRRLKHSTNPSLPPTAPDLEQQQEPEPASAPAGDENRPPEGEVLPPEDPPEDEALPPGDEVPLPGQDDSEDDDGQVENPGDKQSPKLTFKRGWAKGRRTTFFEDYMPDYVSARARGPQQARDYVINVTNDYCAQFTWWLEPPKEPTAEDLAMTDNDLPPGELALKDAKLQRLRVGIRNFLERLSSTVSPLAKMSPSQIKKDPVGSLLAKIGNAKWGITRARTAYQLWSKAGFDSVREGVDKTVAAAKLDAKTERISVAAGRTKAAFDSLPASERRVWELKAEAEKKLNQERRDSAKQHGGVISHTCLDPEATQELLDDLVNKIDPLLRGISMLTGGNTHFYWAGPEPRRGGQINVLSVHAGNNKSAIPRNFSEAGGAEAAGRRRVAEATFGDFALRCYDAQQQAKRTLPGVPPCTAPPSFLRYRPVTWELGGPVPVNALQVTESSDPLPATLPGPSSNFSPPPVPSAAPSNQTGLIQIAPNTSKRKKTTPAVEKPRKRRSHQRDNDSDTENDEEPWKAFNSDGSGDDEPPNRAPYQPGTRSSGRLSSASKTVNSVASPTNAIDVPLPTSPVPMDIDQPFTDPTTDEASKDLVEDMDTDDPTTAAPVEPEVVAQPQHVEDALPEESTVTPPGQTVAAPPTSIAPRTSARTAGRASAKSAASQVATKAASKVATKPKVTGSKVTLPAYITDVQPMFASVNAPHWTALIQKFIEFEGSRKFAEGRLQVGHRPEVVTKWTAARRPHYADGVLPKTMPATFQLVEDAFWVWWRFLQPQWRNTCSSNRKGDISKNPLTSRDRQGVEDTWDRLDVSGPLGFMNIIAYLCMWGKKVKKEQAGEDGWNDAIQDVAWVLDNMTSAGR